MSQNQRFLLLSIHTPYLLVPLEHAQTLMGIIPDCVPADSRYGQVNGQHKYIYSPTGNTVEMKMLGPDDVENVEAKLRSDLSNASTNHMSEYNKRRELEKAKQADSDRLAAIEDKNRELGGLCASLLERIAQQGEALQSKDVQIGILSAANATFGDVVTHTAETPIVIPAPIEGADAALVKDWQAPTVILHGDETVEEITKLDIPDTLAGVDLAEPSAGDMDDAEAAMSRLVGDAPAVCVGQPGEGKTGSIKDLDNEQPLI